MSPGRAWLTALAGFAIWLGCFLLVEPVSRHKAAKVRWLMQNEPGYSSTATYESWEMESWSAGTFSWMVISLVVLVPLFGFGAFVLRPGGKCTGLIRPAIGVAALLATWPFWGLLMAAP